MKTTDEALAALQKVVAISDRKHDAWDEAKAAIAKALGLTPNDLGNRPPREAVKET